MTLLQRIQSNNFAVYLTIFAVVMLFPNCFFVFYKISYKQVPILREIQSVGVGLLISGFILYFTIKKNYEMALRFAYFELFISCCYYFIVLVLQPDGSLHWNWYLLPAMAYGYILPWSVKNCALTIEVEEKDNPTGKVLNEAGKVSNEYSKDLEFNILKMRNPPPPPTPKEREDFESKILKIMNTSIPPVPNDPYGRARLKVKEVDEEPEETGTMGAMDAHARKGSPEPEEDDEWAKGVVNRQSGGKDKGDY